MAKTRSRFESYDIVYKSGTTPFLPAVFLTQGYAWPFEELVGLKPKPKPPMLTVVKQRITYWLFHRSLRRFARPVAARLLRQPKYWRFLLRREREISARLLAAIKTPAPSLFSDRFLNAAGQKKLRNLFSLYGIYGYAIDVLPYLFQLYYVNDYRRSLAPWLRQYPADQRDELFGLIMSAPRLTNSERFALRLNNHILKNRPQREQKKIAAHFYWLTHDYFGQQVDTAFVVQQLNDRRRRPKEELRRENNEMRNRVRLVRELAGQLPKELQTVARQVQDMTYYYNERKKYVVNKVSVWLHELVNYRWPNRSHREKYLLLQQTPAEFLGAFAGAALPDLARRNQAWVFATDGTGMRHGDKRYVRAVRPGRNGLALKGTPASAGQARGRVRVVLNVSQINKFSSGDILVAPYTTVSYLPIMRKARAILTEVGGLTSHAAVVARELGVPCVVGIKGLLSVLNDGDRVLIDAQRGAVKKL